MPDFPLAEFAPAEERPYTTLNEWLAFSEANACTQLEADLGGGGGMISSPCGSSWSALVTSDCQPSALCIQQLDKMELFAEGTNRRKVVMGLLEAAMVCCERFRDYQLSGFLDHMELTCQWLGSALDEEWTTDPAWWEARPGKVAQIGKLYAEQVAKATGAAPWYPYGGAPSAEGMAWISKQLRWFYLMTSSELAGVIANHGGMNAPDPAWWTPRIRAIQTQPPGVLDRWAVCDPEKVQTLQSINVVLQANLVAELLEAGIEPPAHLAKIPTTLATWSQVEKIRTDLEESEAASVQSNWKWYADAADRDRAQAEQWLAENCKIGAYDRAISKSFGRFLAICHPDGRTEIQQATIGEGGSLPELVTVDEGQVVADVAPASPAGGLPAVLLWGGAGFLAAGPTGAAIGAAAGLFYDAQKGKL